MVMLADGNDLKPTADIRDSVVPCQAGIQDCKVRVDEGLNGKVFRQHVMHKLDGFLFEQIFRSFVELEVFGIHR